MPSKFYLTTPIYYVNARPHIGHAYTTVVADVLARRHRLLGDEVYFLTGTDEHGQKIERSAAAAGIPPQQFADDVSKTFSDLWARMGITHNQFIRTTSPAHKQGVQQLFRTLYERGEIYLSSYTGQYSVGEEMFVEGPPGTIGPDGKPTETLTEENFFFRLSHYQLPLLNLIESGELLITPESRRNEVLSFLRGPVPSTNPGAPGLASETWDGSPQLPRTAANTLYVPGALRDLSISRSSFTWGIPVPEDIQRAAGATQPHIIYVWLDALANYITALGYGSEDTQLFDKFWPADLQLVGKEIIRFHCVYWPAFLLAAGLPLPKAVSAHGWLLFDNAKMSKSRGNIVRTETILSAFGTLCPSPPVILSEDASAPQSNNPEGPGPAAAHPIPTANVGAPGLASETWVPPSPGPTPHDRDLFAADVLRYFLLREIPFGQDGSFTFEALITRYNADLANGYGNLVSRVLKMLESSSEGGLQTPMKPWLCPDRNTFWEGEREPVGAEAWSGTAFIIRSVSHTAMFGQTLWPKYQFRSYLAETLLLVSFVDGYISFNKPWSLAKSEDPADQRKLVEVLYTAAESIRIITILLHPILPYATTRVWAQLGLDPAQLTTPNSPQSTLTWGGLPPGTRLGPLAPIFPRADKSLIQKMTDMENESATPKDLTTLTDQADAATPTRTEFAEAPIASATTLNPDRPGPSRFIDESFAAPPTAAAPFDPAAPPRTSAIETPSPGTTVAGSHATTTERTGTPSHTEAHSSGIFNAQSLGAPGLSSETWDGQPPVPQITIDDFAKVELRVAKVIVAERIPKADKLLRLEVDLGYETRQILSGIAEWYTPEDLLGRRIVVITNLAPRKMRGLDSHGMLLAASSEGGRPALATFLDSDQLPLGSRLK